MISCNKIRVLSLIFSILLLSAAGAGAQQNPPPDPAGQGKQPPKPAGGVTPLAPDADDAGNLAPILPAPGTPIETQARIIGKAAPFAAFYSPLHWGPFSVGESDFVTIRDSFEPANGGPTIRLPVSVLRTTLVFAEDFHKIHFVVQYEPQLAFVNGDVHGNASANNALNFATAFDISPRVTLLFRNQFENTKQRQVFPQNVLDIYRATGGILPGNFLENNGSRLEELAALGINIKLSPRWSLMDEPLFRYLSVENKTLGFSAIGRDIRNTLALNYAWSARTNLGVVYTYEQGHLNGSGVGDDYFHGGAVFFARQMSRSFWIRGTAGAEVAFYPVAGPPPVFFTGVFSAVKTFQASAIAVSVARDKELLNYVTDRLNDRVDITYKVPIFRRLSWKNGVGYYHEIGAPPHTQGKYGNTTLEYALPGGFVAYGNYMFRFLSAQTQQLASGTHNTFIFGVRWEPKYAVKK